MQISTMEQIVTIAAAMQTALNAFTAKKIALRKRRKRRIGLRAWQRM